MTLIRISNLTFAYDQNPVLKDLTLEIEEGTLCGIIGPNGVGKSTLLKLISGQLKPSAGRITVCDKEVQFGTDKSRARLFAAVPQESSAIFGYTVSEIVMMARFIRQKRILFEHPDDWRAVQEALQETDMLHLADRPMNQLSGGERQRVYIARALAQETPVLLLDEPASHLDLKYQVIVYDLMKRLQTQKKKTIIMVTHDLNLASQYCDTIVLIGKNGKLLSGPVCDILNKETVKMIFDIECRVIVYQGLNIFVPMGQPVYKKS